MRLEFEIVEEVGQGSYPDLIHFANTQAQVFYIKNGLIEGKPTDKITFGEWESVTFQDSTNISPDESMSHFQIDILPGFGIIGGYNQNTKKQHKLLIYEFAYEMDKYLNSGSIKYATDTPINSFSLQLENPDIKDPEMPGNIAISEQNTLLSPGAKIKFEFSMGDSEPYELGTFYIDRSDFTLLAETARADGRNKIGKVLRDQSLDEGFEFPVDNMNNTIEQILENAQLTKDDFIVEYSSEQYNVRFSPNTDILGALEEIFKVLGDWRIEERPDGTIIIGSSNFSAFQPSGTYLFYRNKDIFSRQITRDDMESYRKVCIYTPNFEKVIYKDVDIYQGWNLLENKTLYVEVPEGTKTSEMTRYGKDLTKRLENVGKTESFTGPFRPYLSIGDEATIVDEDGNNQLGLITELEHIFGKNGYYTNFTVDSGGTLGKGRISDFISKISKSRTSSNIGYDETEEG